MLRQATAGTAALLARALRVGATGARNGALDPHAFANWSIRLHATAAACSAAVHPRQAHACGCPLDASSCSSSPLSAAGFACSRSMPHSARSEAVLKETRLDTAALKRLREGASEVPVGALGEVGVGAAARTSA